MDLLIDVKPVEKKTNVLLSGEIDAFTAPKLKEELMQLAEKKDPQITVCLKDVSYIDSTGLGVFVGLYKKVCKKGGKLKLVNMPARLMRLFNITGLSDIIDISLDSKDGVQ